MNFMKTVAMNPARMNRTGYVPSAKSSTRSGKRTIVHRPTNPMTLVCPQCGAKPGQVCVVLEGQMEVIHSARIEAACPTFAGFAERGCSALIEDHIPKSDQ